MSQITFKGHPIHLQGTFVKKGSRCPDFILVSNDLKDKSLSDFSGKKKLLYFVPSLDTDTCLTSTKKIDQAMKAVPGTIALIISADLPFAQKRICGLENLHLVTPLSTFRSKDFIKNLGLLIDEGAIKGLSARAILVLDEDNTVVYEELVSELSEEPNYEKAFQALKNI